MSEMLGYEPKEAHKFRVGPTLAAGGVAILTSGCSQTGEGIWAGAVGVGIVGTFVLLRIGIIRISGASEQRQRERDDMRATAEAQLNGAIDVYNSTHPERPVKLCQKK